MRMNRRNVLLGLGTVVAGGGAALGTGAFSSVEASREVSIETSGDSSALVGISVSGDLAGTDGDTEIIDLDGTNGVNLDARTEFTDALTITNNRETAGDTITIEIYEGDTSDSLITDGATDDGGLQFEMGSTDANVDVDSGESVDFSVVLGLVGSTDDGSTTIPDSITIEATDTSA